MIFANFRVPTPWRDIVKRTIYEIDDDNCLGLAAQLAFYFLLALLPALLFLVTLMGYLPVENVLAKLLWVLGTVAPKELVGLLRGQLDRISQGKNSGLLTFGAVGAIWSSSTAMSAIIDALNRAYDIAEWRSWWKRQLVAVALTVALALFVFIALVFMLMGPTLAYGIAAWFGPGSAPAVALIWQMVRWPVTIFCLVLGIGLVYHFAPNRAGRWVWITPGALVAIGLWIVSSFALKLYVTNLAGYTATYGAIGGMIVTMLWFYVCGLALLIGAKVNGVIEKAWKSASKSSSKPVDVS